MVINSNSSLNRLGILGCIKILVWCPWLNGSIISNISSQHCQIFKTKLGGISSSVLSVFFTDNCYKLLKSLHLIGWEQICQWKTLTKRLMKCPPECIDCERINYTLITFFFFNLIIELTSKISEPHDFWTFDFNFIKITISFYQDL